MTPTHTYDRPTRPTFVRNEHEEEDMAEEEDEVAFIVNVTTLHDEWDALPRVEEHLNFDMFMRQKREHSNKWNWNDRKTWNKTNDLKYAINKLTLSTFDGSSRVTTRSCISKLDTFLNLRPMSEEDAIRFVALHLDGVAHD